MPAIPASHRDLLDGQFADRVGAKYNANLRDQDQPGQSRVKVAIRPVRVNAVNMPG